MGDKFNVKDIAANMNDLVKEAVKSLNNFRSLTAGEERTLGAGGVQIGEVVRGTPAADANLQTGDFVLKLNGKAIANRAEFQQLLSDNVGKRVTLTINRGGVTMDRLVRLCALAATPAEPHKTEAHK